MVNLEPKIYDSEKLPNHARSTWNPCCFKFCAWEVQDDILGSVHAGVQVVGFKDVQGLGFHEGDKIKSTCFKGFEEIISEPMVL